MVALDQRESMRTLFEEAGSNPAPDSLLSDFKHDAAAIVAERASAVLLDVGFGRRGIEAAAAWPDSCALIVAGDVLTQVPGEAPTEADLDPDLDAAAAREAGAAALKLLLYWRGAENADRCQDTATRFLEICRAHGLVGIVEGVVRPPARRRLLGSRGRAGRRGPGLRRLRARRLQGRGAAVRRGARGASCGRRPSA